MVLYEAALVTTTRASSESHVLVPSLSTSLRVPLARRVRTPTTTEATTPMTVLTVPVNRPCWTTEVISGVAKPAISSHEAESAQIEVSPGVGRDPSAAAAGPE